MVLGILTAVAACPAIIGTTEAVRQGQKENARDEYRGRKHNLAVTLLRRNEYTATFADAPVVLRDNKLWVDVRSNTSPADRLFPYTGYFLRYPGDKEQLWRKGGFARGEGMVTTINDDNFLNWVYVDRQTNEVKYGVRADSDPNRCGPWDATKIDRRLTFEGWEGFIAVQEEDGDGLWALYFDVNDDGLRSQDRIGTKGKRMLEVVVWRKEIRLDRGFAIGQRIERLEEREKLGKTVE